LLIIHDILEIWAGLFYRDSGFDAQHDGQHLGGGMDDMNLTLP
jgi:hypothetical protein